MSVWHQVVLDPVVEDYSYIKLLHVSVAPSGPVVEDYSYIELVYVYGSNGQIGVGIGIFSY
jgi:hypothetical protein